MWVGLGIMKTVTAPIYFGLSQRTETITGMHTEKFSRGGEIGST